MSENEQLKKSLEDARKSKIRARVRDKQREEDARKREETMLEQLKMYQQREEVAKKN